MKESRKFYSVERLDESGQPYTRIEQFDTLEEAEEYCEGMTGVAIVSSIYEYDKDTDFPYEQTDTLKIEKTFTLQ